MSLSEILSSALSGLGAAQAEMRTVSNNIANVNTPGYARQKTALQPSVTAGRTTGVAVGEPTRVADRYLEESVYVRGGDAGQSETVATYLDRLQSLLGATGSEASLPARVDAIAAAATAMAGSSAGVQSRANFIGQVADALGTMRQLQGDVSAIRTEVDGEVGTTVARVNALLAQVADLNDSVARLAGLGRSTAGPADQRTAALQELSGLIGITAREQSTGRVTVETLSGITLLDRRPRQLSYPDGGVDQPVYPAIEVRFAEGGALTGERIDSPAIGGTLGGLIELRDSRLAGFTERLGSLYGGLARALNAASNASTSVPAPARLDGRATALAGGDRLGFTGAVRVAVTGADGSLVASAQIDLAALDTVDAAVAAINAGLGGAATASFADGRLSIAATGPGTGVVVAQDATTPSDRGGLGFAHYFGINDLITSDRGSVAPAGFVGSDPHGFADGSVDLVLHDAEGRQMARAVLTPTPGGRFADLVADLNAGPMGRFGRFALDGAGRMRFEPSAGNIGATIAIRSDTTDRLGTGRSFGDIAGLTGDAAGLAGAQVRRDVLADPARLPLARFQEAGIGERALGSVDRRGALAFADGLVTATDLGKDGTTTTGRLAISLLGDTGAAAARAASRREEMAARRDDAIERRDGFSGVNIDEELAQMVVLQNSYSASARVMTTATQMYESLLSMLG